MQQCTAEDLVEVILPRLVPSLSTWQYLTARAEASSSSLVTNPPAAVAADVAVRNLDIATVLRQYTTLHRCVRSFCDELLEQDPETSERRGKIAEQSTETDPAVASAVPSERNCSRQNDAVNCTDMPPVPNTDGTENASVSSTDGIKMSSSEMLQSTDTSVDGYNSGDVLSVHINGDLSDSVTRSTDRDSRDSECQVLNISKLVTDDSTKTRKFPASEGIRNPETGNFRESNGNLYTSSDIYSATSLETDNVATHAVKSLENSEVQNSDSRKASCATVVRNSADSRSVDAEEDCTLEAAVDWCKQEKVMPLTTDTTPPVTDLQTSCSADTGDTPDTAVTVIDNVLEVSITCYSLCTVAPTLWGPRGSSK